MHRFPTIPHDYYAVRLHPDGTEERKGPFGQLDLADAQAKRWIARMIVPTSSYQDQVAPVARERPLSITLETFENGIRINTQTIRWKLPTDVDASHDDEW
jgi:hypothetical protein